MGDMPAELEIPLFTLDDYEQRFSDRHRLDLMLAKWAAERPELPALLSADGKRQLSWSAFDEQASRIAAALRGRGVSKGDYVVTLLPLTIEHVLIEFACFRLGAVLVPLDLRMSAAEVTRAVNLLGPRALIGLGNVGSMDFSGLWRAVEADCAPISVRLVVGTLEGAASLGDFLATALTATSYQLPDATHTADDGALVIFTTGSTGSPKPALLSHKNITVQAMCLSGAFFGGDEGRRTLVNLPPSHVGCQTEALIGTLFGGGSVVLLEMFDAGRSMRAISELGVEILGQIPAMFSLEWMLKDYASHDLSSLKFAAYGGNAVSRPFVERLAGMAPVVGTGLGLTEAAGFCSYVRANAEEHEMILAGLGVAQPIYPCTVREPMREDGTAGQELAAGEIGHICYRGPQTFLGYVNDEEATRKTVSTDGYLYTGDLGRMDAEGLHLTGRAKWVIKSMGYQVFPGDVEAHISHLQEKVANCVVVGVPHELTSEAVVAVVERRADAALSVQELDRHARELTVYMRPRHWIILEPGTLPLNRVVKPDVNRVRQMALEEIERLRAAGGWDAEYRK